MRRKRLRLYRRDEGNRKSLLSSVDVWGVVLSLSKSTLRLLVSCRD